MRAPASFPIAALVGIAGLSGVAFGQLPQNSPHASYNRAPAVSEYLYGKVVLDDGTPAPDSVAIERVCNGTVRRETYTDSKGRFSFEIGRTTSAMQDSTTNSTKDAATGPVGSGGVVLSSNTGLNSIAGGLGRFADCDLRAVLPGFRSDLVSLSNRRISNTPDLGSIVLHRLDNLEGTVVSKTSLEAPPAARKAYEKGRQAALKNKPEKARVLLEQAVALYPRHAAAWYELGRLQTRAGNLPQAGQDFERSLAVDPKFVSPYLPLAEIAVRTGDWHAAADTTDRLIALDAVDYPQAYYYNALANLHLKKLSEAAARAREAKKLDTAHAFPKIDHVLGMIRAEQHDYSAAATALRSYLQFAPEDHDAATARMQLAEVEKIAGPALVVSAQVLPAGAAFQAAIHIDAGHITLTEREGKWIGQLRLAISYEDSSATRPPQFLPIQLRFTPQVLERVRAAGLTLHQELTIPAGARAMLVDVRDVPSGAAGTFTVDLPRPPVSAATPVTEPRP